MADTVVATGRWGQVVWATDHRGLHPAHDYFEDLGREAKAKLIALFRKLAEQGHIDNREKFKKLGEKAGRYRDLWELKSFQQRFIGDYRPGCLFLIADGLTKKSDDLPKPAIERAGRILAEHDARLTSRATKQGSSALPQRYPLPQKRPQL